MTNFAGYATVYVGFPIWWYREPSIVDTFVESNAEAFAGKTIVPFATSGGSDMGDSSSNLQKLAPKAKVAEGRRFRASADADTLHPAARGDETEAFRVAREIFPTFRPAPAGTVHCIRAESGFKGWIVPGDQPSRCAVIAWRSTPPSGANRPDIVHTVGLYNLGNMGLCNSELPRPNAHKICAPRTSSQRRVAERQRNAELFPTPIHPMLR